MKKYIGTDGIPVDEYELEDVQLLLYSPEFFLESRLEKNLETGEKRRRIIPANVKKAVQAEKVRICEQDVKTKLEAFKNGFNKKLEKSPDKAATIALELKHWETVFDVSENSTQHTGLITNGHELIRRAWRQILNGERNYTVNKGQQILIGHNFAEARFEYLKWLRELQKNQKPEMIAGQAFAFSADGKQIENHPLQTIVEYFNEKGAEVQLFTKGNEYALLSISAGIDKTELDELARYEADTMELQVLFSLKFSQAQKSGKVSTQQSFAKAEANRLRRAWKDDASRFPIAEQWLSYLQAIAEAKEQPKGDADTSTAPQERKDGTEAENGVQQKSIIFTDSAIIDALHEGLKAFFPNREKDLRKLLDGGTIDTPLHFPDQQNRLAEVFSKAYYNGKLGGTKTDVQAWIIENFTYQNGRTKKQTPFSQDTLRSIFNPSGKGEVTKGKRIAIVGLEYIAPENRAGYAVK